LRFSVNPKDAIYFVQLHDFFDDEYTCDVRDYSRTGLSFYLEDGSLLFKIGDIISHLRFFSHDKEFFQGSATIIHVQDENQSGRVFSRIGVRLHEKQIDISSVIKIDKITKLKTELNDFIQSLARQENLDPEFVKLTHHMHYMLKNFEEQLKFREKHIHLEDKTIRQAMLDVTKDVAFKALQEYLVQFYGQFSEITSKFSTSNQHSIHREFFQKRLYSFIMQSKLLTFAYTKPHGYAGDFELMSIIHRNQFEGETLFSQVMNKIDCEGTTARAIRNRISFVVRQMEELINSNRHAETFKVVSLASGPAFEISNILLSQHNTNLPTNLEFVLVDQDRSALKNAQSRLNPLIKNRNSIVLHFVQDSIKRLIVDADNNNNRLYENADLIYSLNLFDYLSNSASMRLIFKLYTLLKPGGRLIVCNMGNDNPQRFSIEYCAQWYLIHRSEAKLQSLAAGLPEGAVIKLEKEQDGCNLYLIIQKPLNPDDL